MMKPEHALLLAALLAAAVLLSGCAQPSPLPSASPGAASPEASSMTSSAAGPGDGGPRMNCDNVCDAFEKEHPESPCYKPDCLGVRETGGQPSPPGAPSGQPPGAAPASGGPGGPGSSIAVNATGAAYRAAARPAGWLKTGQPADLLLSGIDFNNTGGPLLFNHPGGIASDGTRLFLADKNNNRVLVWNRLPEGNTAPDLVLGQPDFASNDPGTGPAQMNWPAGVSAAGGKVAVADSYNDRILLWNSPPARSGQPADLVLELAGQPGPGSASPQIRWPWGVWTDGTKLAVSSTGSGSVLIWNTFPARGDQAPDVVLTAQNQMGTPRSITSNSRYLIVADYNARTVGGSATFVWKTWPTASDAPYDFTLDGWRSGAFTSDDRLVLLSTTHFPPSIWNAPPAGADDTPDLVLEGGHSFTTGDGSGIAAAGGRLYLSLANDNKIVVYNSLPTSPRQPPDFAIGAPDTRTNTLDTNYFITNPLPASGGKSLFVSSDFDRRLYVWKSLPDQSGAHPDIVYSLPEAPWDNALWKDTLALAGKRSVYVWEKLPLNGELPDLTPSLPQWSWTGAATMAALAVASALLFWRLLPEPSAPPPPFGGDKAMDGLASVTAALALFSALFFTSDPTRIGVHPVNQTAVRVIAPFTLLAAVVMLAHRLRSRRPVPV